MSESLQQLLRRVANAQAHRPCVVSQQCRLSYHQVYERVMRMADFLDANGRKYLEAEGYCRWLVASKGHDNVLMRLDNCADNVITQLGCAVAGSLLHTVRVTPCCALTCVCAVWWVLYGGCCGRVSAPHPHRGRVRTPDALANAR